MRSRVPLPLSITIVTFNNERTLPRVLASIRGLASELIVLDSGSTDGTLAMLHAESAIVVHQPWLGYVRQKQAALDRCTQHWVLHLDSDESIEPALRASIEDAVTRDDPSVAGYELNRKVWYAGRFLEHAWQPEWRLRLIRRGRARWTGDDPHDALMLLPLPGQVRIERLEGDLRHDSIPTITEFLEKAARHAATGARAQHARGRRGSILSLLVSPRAEFLKQIILRRAFLDGWRGWVAARASAAAVAMKHAALLELSRTEMNTEDREKQGEEK